MRRRKTMITAMSFALGACLFVSTAFADMSLGTGYDQLKYSIKHTADQMEHGLDNYTTETMLTIQVDGQTVMEALDMTKTDIRKQASESTSTTRGWNGDHFSYYSYSDPTVRIWKSNENPKYIVTEYPNGSQNYELFSNPFKEDGAAEFEKIVDALVGNLKDAVQAEERPDGSRVYSGSLSEAQVPALINAVSSFLLKQTLLNQSRSDQLPDIQSDISIRKVTGRAVENEAGLLESLTGEVMLAGKDAEGAQHDISLSVVFKLTDMGSTQVNKPELTDTEVEKVEYVSGFSSKHVGTYKNNIVIEKDGKFVKIGERTLEILSVEGGKVTGKYYETVEPEFAADYPENLRSFTFEYAPDASRPVDAFSYTNADGEQVYGTLHPGSPGKVWIDLELEMIDERSYRSGVNHEYFDGELHLVFE